MAEWGVEQFDDFFNALWGEPDKPRPPFAWQRALAARVLTRTHAPWPEAIDRASRDNRCNQSS